MTDITGQNINDNTNTNNNTDKKFINLKKTKLLPIKIKLKQNKSQENILKTAKKKVIISNLPIVPQNEKKLFNNANNYQYLYRDKKNTGFVALWVKELRNIPYNPGPIRDKGGLPPSFYQRDLNAFLKRYKVKKKNENNKNNNNNSQTNDLTPKWNNLSVSNEIKNQRFNEYLPHMISKNDRYFKIRKKSSDDSNDEISLNKSRYLHPFIYNYRNVKINNGNKIKQKYIKYDVEKTLQSPSLIFNRSVYNDKCSIKNYNRVKDYLNMANAINFVKWQSRLRSYEKSI